MNRVLALMCMALFLSVFLLLGRVEAWDNKVTHTEISLHAALQCDLETKGYLKKIGFPGGLGHIVNGTEIIELFREGAKLEDAADTSSIVSGKARYYNHFHDSTKPWSSAGLNDYVRIYGFPTMQHVTGESSLLWAQDRTKQATAPEGDQSWTRLREAYYVALTSKDDRVREDRFAKTFKGLGFQMHLIQDATVPEHARNDEHAIEGVTKRSKFGYPFFESWTAQKNSKVSEFASSAIFPQITFNPVEGELVPITRLIDGDTYDGENPSSNLSQGLAEYTNANFFSDDTIFAAENKPSGSRHHFPYPKESGTNLED